MANTDAVAEDMLKSFVRRIEATEDEIKALNGDKSEIYKEAKAGGFDVKVLRKVVAARRMGAAERAEQDAIFNLYWHAIHGVGSLVRAHVENTEEFDPETGEITEPASSMAAAGEAGIASSPAPIAEMAVPGDGLPAAMTEGAGPVTAPSAPNPKIANTLALRPHCRRPEMCGGEGRKHCPSCDKIWAEAHQASGVSA